MIPRRIRLLFATLAAMTAVAALPAAEQAPTAQDEPASLSLADLSGQKRSLEDYRGRIVVLNFWATWCVPCREEMPLLVKLQRHYESQGVVVIGASADDASTRDQIAPFVRKLKINFPIWTGAATADMLRLGLGAALPATAIIDRDAHIAARILGPVDEKGLRERIDWLLSDRREPTPAAVVDNFGKHAHEGHAHAEGEDHRHGAGLDGASTVPS